MDTHMSPLVLEDNQGDTKMTREVYTHIFVPTQLHNQLKTLAQ